MFRTFQENMYIPGTCFGEDNILRGKGKQVLAMEQKIKHNLLPHNTWRLIPYFEVFILCPKDELHQWYANTCLSMV